MVNTHNYEYQVALVLQNRVTLVNGKWQGSLAEDQGGAIESCPLVWDYLNETGAWGWELVTVVGQESALNPMQSLYLRRGR